MLKSFWRLCFRLLYNELAFTYDIISRLISLGHWGSWQRCVLPYLPAPNTGVILELAHGTGDLQIDLLREGYKTVALDLSPYMGQLAQRKLRHANLNAYLVRGDALRLPYRSNAIAAAVCTFPTPFIFCQHVLDELARVLQPSGRIVVVLVGQLRGRGLCRQLIRQLYRLSGQRDALLSESAVFELFSTSHFHVKNHVVTIGSTAAQVAVLTAVPRLNLPQPDVSLDFAHLS